jgi:hypothetical protein
VLVRRSGEGDELLDTIDGAHGRPAAKPTSRPSRLDAARGAAGELAGSTRRAPLRAPGLAVPAAGQGDPTAARRTPASRSSGSPVEIVAWSRWCTIVVPRYTIGKRGAAVTNSARRGHAFQPWNALGASLRCGASQRLGQQ